MRKLSVIVLVLAGAAAGLIGRAQHSVAPAPLHLSEPRPSVGAAQTLAWLDQQLPDLEASLIVEGLDRPTFAVAAPDGQIFVAEKGGVIRVVRGNTILEDPLLDLDAAVIDHRPERGLLAMALHPGFADNGRFYLHLTDAGGDSRLIEYLIDPDDPDRADPDSARLVLSVEQPGEFHNGGMLQFGPDGYLFVAMGDGDFGDSDRNAAVRSNLLGSILRIDVDAAEPYAVPFDNPYVGSGSAPEIWMSGLRNPWRFFIDNDTRSIVIGDVGQFRWEEIQVLPLDAKGLDLGWPTLEGRHCYEATECDADGFVLPDIVYSHSQGCAVVAGPIYRGSLVPELTGMIVYADYCTGSVRAYALGSTGPARTVELVEAGTYGPILSLALDGEGNVLLLTEIGEMRRLRPAG